MWRSHPSGASKELDHAPEADPGQIAVLALICVGKVQEPTGGSQAHVPQEAGGMAMSV